MKFRVHAVLLIDSTETVTLEAIKTQLLALKDKLRKISFDDNSFVTVEKCYHDEGRGCETILSWKKE